MCKYRTIQLRRVRYHHSPNCTTQTAPPQNVRVTTPEDERFGREVVGLIMNSEPREVPLTQFMAEQSRPERPSLGELVMGRGAAVTEPVDVQRGRQAIEDGSGRVSAEAYVRGFRVEPELKERKNKT